MINAPLSETTSLSKLFTWESPAWEWVVSSYNVGVAMDCSFDLTILFPVFE